MKKPATTKERKHLSAVAGLGCIVCMDLGFPETPAQVHHIDRSRDHTRVLPLCPWHHLDGGYGFAIHAGRPIWHELYGTEEDLLVRVNKQVGITS